MAYCFCHFILSKFAGTHHVRLVGGSGNQTNAFFQSVNSGLHNKLEKKEKNIENTETTQLITKYVAGVKCSKT